ncbi:MAG TPA: transglycosylase SLT domain-containing protein [Myxococcaceae bacterium]|nr:transglycosylase SLT domain-containing protein [Myxococcaceae bacterium]
MAARGQSERLLEATRLQRSSSLEMAQAELSACARKGCAQAPQLSLLIGSLLISRGEPREALAQLRRHPAPPLLAPYRSFAIGQGLFYTRDFRGAAQAFSEAVGAPGVVASRAVARAGESLLRAGEPGQALPLLERALGALGGPELLADRSEARAALGDLLGAQADLHTLMVRYPRSQAALDADAQLRGSSAPAVALTLDERLQRTRVFLDAGDARLALAELDRSEANGLVGDATSHAQVALLRAQAFFALNRVEEGEEALQVAAGGPPATAAEAMLVRARRLLKLDEHAKAVERLQEISKRFAGEPASEEADYFLGWLALQEGKLKEAADALESFEKKHPESRRRDEACWFRALAQIRAGSWGEADRALRELQDRYPRSGLVPQAKYWRVRVKQLAGGKPVEDYQDILKLYPQSFYGLLAQERLRELGSKPEVFFTERPRLSTKVAPAPELALPQALARSGLWRESAEELRARLGAVHTPEAALRVGTALARVGEAWAAYGLANRLLWGKAYGQKDPGALALLYPRPYVSHVDETARAQGVHSSLLYAIMRRESAFQPDRLSAARARGLMQLMARTASAIARELQRDPPEPDELYRPELNLDLSAWYVGQLAKRFVHPVLIAAAYNAGPAVTVRWSGELGSMPVDLFVESIPFKETRAYVKQVVADDYMYQAFYGGSEVRRLAMNLPKPAVNGIEF